MTAIIVIAVIGWIICMIADESGFLAKCVFAGIVASIAFLIIGAITEWELMFTLAKICGCGALVAVAGGLIFAIFSGN